MDQDVIIEDDTRESGYRSTNAYYDKDEEKLAKSIMNPLNYDFIFVLGIPLGAILMDSAAILLPTYPGISSKESS